MTRVLVVEDEPSILRALRINLSAREYDVSTAVDGTSGLAAVARDRPDVIILDLGLPDMDGTDVIHGVRGWTSIPIIVLSAGARRARRSPRSTPVRTLRDQAVRHGRAAGAAAGRGPAGFTGLGEPVDGAPAFTATWRPSR